MSILLINMSKVISLKEQKNILVYLYASWLIQYWLIVCDRAHQLIRLIPHFRALCSSTDIHWLKCVTMFHCSVLDSPHSHQPHHIGWSAGFFTQSFANPYLVILPPAPMHLMLIKNRPPNSQHFAFLLIKRYEDLIAPDLVYKVLSRYPAQSFSQSDTHFPPSW